MPASRAHCSHRLMNPGSKIFLNFRLSSTKLIINWFLIKKRVYLRHHLRELWAFLSDAFYAVAKHFQASLKNVITTRCCKGPCDPLRGMVELQSKIVDNICKK